jgi:curved DNA-binding protein CbpA
MRQNLYDLLGVRPDDDAETLRKAFLKAAKESHPDHNGDDPEAAARFRQIAEAYETLRDPDQRAAYDRLHEFERKPLRPELTAAPSGAKRRMAADAVIGVILAVVLAGGYELNARMWAAADEAARIAARGPAEIAANKPAETSGAAGRDRPAGAPAPQMPLVLPIENPVAPVEVAPARQTIEVARSGNGSDLPADRLGATAGRDASAKDSADEPQHQYAAQSFSVHVVQAPAADTNIVPGPSSSDIASLASRPGRDTPEAVGAGPSVAKQPTESIEANASARIHAAMRRPLMGRAPFRHAALARRYTRMHGPHCWHRWRNS